MTRELEILHHLLDRYERSGHCLPERESSRRIMLNMTRGEYSDYRENDPSVVEVNHAIQTLAGDGLVSFSWRKGYEGWLVDRVYLNLDSLDRAYSRADREPISETANTLYHIISDSVAGINTPWKLRFLEDEVARLQKRLCPSRLFPGNVTQAEEILKVLEYTEHGPELMRVISANCFHDSKYLERNMLSQLVSIAKAYEPDLISYRAMGDEYLTQNVALEQIGILTYPEIFEFCGNIRLSFPTAKLNTAPFQNGFCLQSENLRLLIEIDISHINALIFVENRTNYRHLILEGISDDTLVIYHGGFYSPVKRRLFNMLSDSAKSSVKVLFWGDIDLGGFLMFTRLKKELFPNLIPWKMGLENFEEYKEYGVKRPLTYFNSLRNKLEEEQFDPCFFPVARAIIKEGVTVEQEIML